MVLNSKQLRIILRLQWINKNIRLSGISNKYAYEATAVSHPYQYQGNRAT